MVVDRDGQFLLGAFLPDHVEVEELLDLFRFRERSGAFQSSGLVLAVFSDDVEADVDALIADVNRGPRDQLLYVALRLVAEATPQNVAAVSLLRHWPWALYLMRSLDSSTRVKHCQEAPCSTHSLLAIT